MVWSMDGRTDVRTYNKAIAPSTAFWVLCMAYMSRADDVSRASNQSCNGRDGEKLERKECKKVNSPRRYMEL